MIFVQGEKEPLMFLMLNEQDVKEMREGRTKFVDERQTGGTMFTGVILSLHASDAAALKLLKDAAPNLRLHEMPEAQPKDDQGRCQGCNGCIPITSLFEGRCIVCWASEAKKARTKQN